MPMFDSALGSMYSGMQLGLAANAERQRRAAREAASTPGLTFSQANEVVNDLEALVSSTTPANRRDVASRLHWAADLFGGEDNLPQHLRPSVYEASYGLRQPGAMAPEAAANGGTLPVDDHTLPGDRGGYNLSGPVADAIDNRTEWQQRGFAGPEQASGYYGQVESANESFAEATYASTISGAYNAAFDAVAQDLGITPNQALANPDIFASVTTSLREQYGAIGVPETVIDAHVAEMTKLHELLNKGYNEADAKRMAKAGRIDAMYKDVARLVANEMGILNDDLLAAIGQITGGKDGTPNDDMLQELFGSEHGAYARAMHIASDLVLKHDTVPEVMAELRNRMARTGEAWDIDRAPDTTQAPGTLDEYWQKAWSAIPYVKAGWNVQIVGDDVYFYTPRRGPDGQPIVDENNKVVVEDWDQLDNREAMYWFYRDEGHSHGQSMRNVELLFSGGEPAPYTDYSNVTEKLRGGSKNAQRAYEFGAEIDENLRRVPLIGPALPYVGDLLFGGAKRTLRNPPASEIFTGAVRR